MGKEPKIDPQLLAQAQEAGVAVDEVIEEALRAALREAGFDAYRGLTDEEKAQKWAEENAEAIEAQRKRIEAFGVFGEDLRTW